MLIGELPNVVKSQMVGETPCVVARRKVELFNSAMQTRGREAILEFGSRTVALATML